MFRDIIKNVLFPALKDELKKTCEDWIEYTLYSEPYDFSKVVPVPYSGKQKTTYVIGKCIVRY